jgi:tetratricopeptide (TPR) repeat protein
VFAFAFLCFCFFVCPTFCVAQSTKIKSSTAIRSKPSGAINTQKSNSSTKTNTTGKVEPKVEDETFGKDDGTGKVNKQGKRFSPKMMYHNLTVRYNFYYNARLKLNLALDKVKNTQEDDYTKILPLYPDEADASSVNPDMDEVIKKMSNAIQLHQPSVWKPDCYLMMGRAYYYKKEYTDALEVFQYLQTHFKIKTIKGVPVPTKKLFHQPVTDVGLLWLIKTYIQMEKYNEADAVMAEVESRKGFPEKLKNDLKLLHTYLYIKSKDYKRAIPQVTEAIKLTTDKKLIPRYTFIAAQIREASGNKTTAIKSYKEVLALKPDFVMDFNARKKIVELYGTMDNAPAGEVRTILMGMLADKRFKDYWDVVYYMLAKLELKGKNDKQAIAQLKNSIFYSTTNATQKGLSFELMADVYYKKSQYILARNRYDSTLHYLSTNHEDYTIVKEKKEILDNVVAKIRIIQKEDSLQKLANLSPQALEKKVSRMLEAKHRKELNDSLDKSIKQQANNDNKVNGQNDDAAVWYFYNPSLKGSGYNDFIRKWGNRTLADNWRRNNKQSIAGSGNEANKDKDDENEDKPKQKDKDKNEPTTELEKALADIPTTAEGKEESDKKIINAYFELANIYKSKLNNNKKSIETFEKLLERYPSNKFQKECYYNLYLLYERLPDYAKSELYKNKILNNFAGSTFAKAIKDPDYSKKISKSETNLNKYYEQTYQLYINGDYQAVLSNCSGVDSLFKNNKLQSKFDLLAALSLGKTQDLSVFTASLQKIVGKYPNTDVKTKAQDILNSIDKRKNDISSLSSVVDTKNKTNETPKDATKQKYLYEPGKAHFILIVFTNISPKNTAVVSQISNYNTQNHSLDNIEVRQELLNSTTEFCSIKNFKNAQDAMEYSEEIDSKGNLFKPLTPDDYQIIVITNDNFAKLQKSGDVEEYRNFYEENYNK